MFQRGDLAARSGPKSFCIGLWFRGELKNRHDSAAQLHADRLDRGNEGSRQACPWRLGGR